MQGQYQTPAAVAARSDLQLYIRSVIDDEWPLLATSRRSPKTDVLYRKFGADVRLLEPETDRQKATETGMLGSLDEMGELRESRIAAVEFGLPPIYWWVMAGLFGIILVLAFFNWATIDRMLANCGMICAIGILLTLVLLYEDSFAGDIRVAPTALRRVLGLMNLR